MMISPPSKKTKPADSLPVSEPRKFEVMVPVFVKVVVTADDDLAAEMLAIERLRGLPPVLSDGGSCISVQGIIHPMVK